ncbi:sodium/proline symporter, partial [Candidatus Dependentiae bacterium]
PKIRVETEKYQALTLFSYFEKRFSDNSGIIRLLSSLISVVFLTFYISSGLVAMGRLFENAFGTSYVLGIFLGLAITVIYTLIGGFVAVAWCDFFQGLFAIVMIILVPTMAYYLIGGWPVIAQAAAEKQISLSLVPAAASIWTILAFVFTWGPGYFGQAHLLSFFMGIDDPKKIKYAKYVGLTWQALALLFAIFIGVVGIAYFHTGAEAELIYILLTKLLFSPFIAGFVLCAILAVTLSTLDTQILSSGTILAEDFYKKIVHKKASSKTIVLMSRLFSITISSIAIIIAFDGSKTIYDLVNYAWSGMGSAFGPLVIASLYSKKVNKYGAMAGIITGSVVSGAWYLLKIPLAPLIPGFIASAIAIYLVSYVTRNK